MEGYETLTMRQKILENRLFRRLQWVYIAFEFEYDSLINGL